MITRCYDYHAVCLWFMRSHFCYSLLFIVSYPVSTPVRFLSCTLYRQFGKCYWATASTLYEAALWLFLHAEVFIVLLISCTTFDLELKLHEYEHASRINLRFFLLLLLQFLALREL
jgi:hypothetical protein